MSIAHVLCMTGNLNPLFLKFSWMHFLGKMALVKLLQEQFPANSWQFICLVSVALLDKVLGSRTVVPTQKFALVWQIVLEVFLMFSI